MEESNTVRYFRYNMYMCTVMMLVCFASAMAFFTKTYKCPNNSSMLRDTKLCAENPVTFQASLDEHNKNIYEVVFIISSVLFTITTIIYFIMYKKIENSGQTNELMQSLR